MLGKLLALVAAALPSALATITKLPITDMTLMQKDSYVFYMNEVFDVSKVKGIPTFQTSFGDLRTYKTPIAKRDLTGSFAKVEVVEFIDNSTFGVVLDNSHAIIQAVDLEGNRFTENVDFTYVRFGSNVRCDDLEYYKPTQMIYIACWDIEDDPQAEPGPLFLIEVELFDTSKYRVIDVNQTDGFHIQHRIRMGIWNLPQAGANETYLILYDQGMSSTEVFNNKWMRVFDGIRTGKADYAGVVDIQKGFPNARALYDIFYFNEQLLMTTSIQGETFISMTSCNFFIKDLSVACNEGSRKVSNVSFGYVGMSINHNWVQFDLNSNEFVTCDVGSDFSKAGWKSQDCEVYKSMPKFDECFIRIVEDNYHAKVIIWVYPNGEYAGISAYSRELNRSWKEEDVTAVLMNKYLYTAEIDKLTIRRLDYDNVLIKAEDLPSDQNSISFTAADSESSGVTNGLIINHMYDAKEMIGFRDDHYLPEVDVYGGNTFYMPLTEDDFLGNNLEFSTTFDDSIENYTSTHIYNTYRLNIFYTFKKTGLPEFSEITFTPNYAVGKDLQNRIFFFSCGSTELDQMRCDEQYSFTVNQKTVLQQYSRELLGYVMVWTKDNIKTTVYLWDPNSGDIFSNEFPGAADDVHAIVVNSRGWIFVAYTGNSEVKVNSWSPVNPSNFNEEPSLTLASSNMPHFCPSDIYDTFNGQTGYLEVLSVCASPAGKDQRIFRYDPFKLYMVGSHPISLDITDPKICAAGDSYIIASFASDKIYGKRQMYDESHFEFYLDSFAEYTNILGMNCVPQSNMMTIYFEDKFHKLGFFTIWVNSHKKANKRIHTTVTNLPVGTLSLQSFSINGNLIHTLYDSEGSLNYYVSLSKVPMVRINVAAISSTTNNASGVMTLSLSNGGGGGSSTQAFLTIRRMDSQITTSKAGNTTKIDNNFQLEDYLTIKGHVFNATLRDTRSSKSKENGVTLIQRADKMAKFVPPEVEQVIYQHIEAHGEYTIALHMDISYASFFTIFTNVTTHRGVIQPRDGVKAFDFGLLNGGKALIAYSSAPVSGNKLKLMLINGADKISEASAAGKEYSKIRLLPLDDKDNLVLFALDQNTLTVDVFQVNVTNNVAQIYSLNTFDGVADFDITDPGKYLTFYYLNDEGTDLRYITWYKNDISGKRAGDGTIRIQGDHKYWFMSVDCLTQNVTHSTCVINTLGTIIYEAVIETNKDGDPDLIYTIKKFGDYDGKYIYVDSDYITMRAVTGAAPRHYAFLVWKRGVSGGDGNLYYGINIDGAARPGTDINSGFTPYTMIKTPNGDHVLYAATHNELEPLQFYKIDRFRISSNASKADLSSIYLDIEGYSGSQVEVGTLADFSSDDKKNLKWWVPTLIVIVLLVGAAVTYFICVNNSKTENAEQEGNYRAEEDGGNQLLVPKENKNDA